jgi:mannosyltransferase
LRNAPILLLVLALALGALLRFSYLGAYEMSADEGASWAAAAQPSLLDVLHSQRHLNPAELGLHDLTLHYWMDLFGDSLLAMRTLSALAGTLAIFLTWTAVRELLALDTDAGSPSATAPDRDLTAALAALMLAVNLITIKYSRELRMYPLMLALVLAQITSFLRARRRTTPASYFGTSIFTALALAAHPMALFILASEAGWMLYSFTQTPLPWSMSSARRLIYLAAAVGAGVIVAALAALPMLASSNHGAHSGLLNWVARPALWEPFALFNKGLGSIAFPLFDALALWGIFCGWRNARSATIFALLWMWLPPLALLAASYAIRPVFVERYLLASFVPFFILTAIGIMALPSNLLRTTAAVLVVVFALGHDFAWSRKPHDTQWREGMRIAAATALDRPIGIAPGYAINVARYYLAGTPQLKRLVDVTPPPPYPADVLLLADQSKGDKAVKLTAQYPHIVARLRGLQVRCP